jgi:hypothetical protein
LIARTSSALAFVLRGGAITLSEVRWHVEPQMKQSAKSPSELQIESHFGHRSGITGPAR